MFSDGYIYDLDTMKARVTRNIDESKQDDSSTLEPTDSQWYYNQVRYCIFVAMKNFVIISSCQLLDNGKKKTEIITGYFYKI